MAKKAADEPTAERTDQEAVSRLEVAKPGPGGQQDAGLSEPDRKPFDGEMTLDATCGVVTGRPSSTTGGARGSVRFDQMNKVTTPFQILAGGYQIIFKNGKWSQVFGSEAKKRRFAREDRRGHRSEQRNERRRLKRADLRKIRAAERKFVTAA